MSEGQVRCLHILQKHSGSRNPINRRKGQQVTRSKEEAIANIQGIKAQISSAEDFQRLA